MSGEGDKGFVRFDATALLQGKSHLLRLTIPTATLIPSLSTNCPYIVHTYTSRNPLSQEKSAMKTSFQISIVKRLIRCAHNCACVQFYLIERINTLSREILEKFTTKKGSIWILLKSITVSKDVSKASQPDQIDSWSCPGSQRERYVNNSVVIFHYDQPSH